MNSTQLIIILTISLASCLFHAKAITNETKTPLVSVQLHSVKNTLTEDFKGTLTELSKTGIDGVEFAGRFGPYKNNPKGLKVFLNSLNLKASGAHIGLPQLRGEHFQRNVNFYKALGVTLLIVPHDGRVDQPAEIDSLVQELSQISNKLNVEGLTLAYHNHAKEFAPFNNSTFWDYLAQNTPTTMALQLDVGWANFAKVDAITYVKRYANRTLSTHIKIRTTDSKKHWDKIDNKTAIVIGQDDYDWAKLINTMMAEGGTQWLVVEQEETHTGKSRLETVSQSILGLQDVLTKL